jgi:PHD/YefM family antitoxin component YafN of YafNO toxin-antitoxin module
MSDEISMRPSELRSTRDAMRTMPKLIQALNDGEVEKYVLMKRGRAVAVLLDVDDYSEMVEKAKARLQPNRG